MQTMIFLGLLGACILGGLTIQVMVLFKTPWKKAIAASIPTIVLGAALGIVAGLDNNDNPECSSGEVMAAKDNDLFQGCVPVELAKKQLERQ